MKGPDDLDSRIRRRGLMLVLSSPSGAGKSTIARNLIEKDPAFELSVSVTTRPRRASEIDGVHYHFRTRRDFDILRENDELLEWAEVHGNFYATPREPAERAMAEGRDMLFDIDWQGAKQLKEDAGRHSFDLHPSAFHDRIEGQAHASRRRPGKGHRNPAQECARGNRALDRI
jgi:guanylate kinase